MTPRRRCYASSIAFLILVLLHFSLRPLLGWRAEIDFLLIAVLLAAVRVRPGAAAIMGFVVGLAGRLADAERLWRGRAGHDGRCASRRRGSRPSFFADNLALNGFFFFAGRWAYAIIYVLAEHQRQGDRARSGDLRLGAVSGPSRLPRALSCSS